jgi:2-phosphoglycerate kinase
MLNSKPIYLIGGSPGTGKTTLARELCSKEKIDHRIGTGYIREIVSSFSEPNYRILNKHTFDSTNPIKNLIEQSYIIKPFVEKCIERSLKEGTSLVIEGSHLIPDIYYSQEGQNINYFVLGASQNPETHMKMLLGDTHLHRKINAKQFESIRLINDYYIHKSNKLNVEIKHAITLS